jgi:hypothetical protein
MKIIIDTLRTLLNNRKTILLNIVPDLLINIKR